MKQVLLLILVIMVIGNWGGGAAFAALGPSGLDVDNLPELEVRSSSSGGKLLFSDSPEMVKHDGILYQDMVEGKVRLFFYHVNASSDVKKMAVLLENKGKKAAYVTVNQASIGGPGYNWMAVGKEAQKQYFTENNNTSYQINIPPGGVKQLAADIESMMMPDMLINGIYDFSVDGPVNVKVVMLPVNEDSVNFSKTLKILPADQCHLRGTFEGANREISPLYDYDPVHDGAIGITLADNRIDAYLKGIDATDGSEVVNYGNYGVVYQVLLPSEKGSRIACYLVPIAGHYAGAIKINHPEVYWSPLATPRDRLYFIGNHKQQDFAFLGTFESGDPLSFTFSPPGASNLPVKIVVAPQ